MHQLPHDNGLPRDGDVAPKTFSTDKTEYPQLNLRVAIIGNCFRAGAIRMFSQAGCTMAKTVEESDLVVFLGGEDIDPSLYDEKPHKTTYSNIARDNVEMDVFETAVMHDIPMFGICRGMQLLHALNGGKLYQHVPNHAGSDHSITVEETGEVIQVSSMHHQMCILNDNMIPVAYATKPGQGGVYHQFNSELHSDYHKDLEAAIYPDINAFAVQGHPECEGTPRYRAWCLEQIGAFIASKSGDTWAEVPAFMKVDV